jgi:hypothetical protein
MADVSVSPELLQGALAMSTITTILLLVLIVAMFNPQLVTQVRAALGGAAATGGPGVPSGLTVIFGILGAVAPDIALISGYVGDIVSGGLGKFRWSLTSILGIVAVILNKLIWGYAMGGDSITRDLTALGDAATRMRTTTQPAAAASTTDGGYLGGLADLAGGLAAVGAAGGPVIPPPTETQPPPARAAVSFGGPGSVSTLGTAIRGALAPAAPQPRSATVGERFAFGRPTGGVTSRGRSVKPSGTAMESSAVKRGRTVGGGQTGGARFPESVTSSNPCVIRGLGFLDTQSSPMGMVVLSFVFIVYFLDMWWNQKRTRSELAGNFFFGLFVILVNAFALGVFECYGATSNERIFAIAKALTIGLLFGGSIFALYQTYGQQYLPVDASPASISGGGGGGSIVPPGSTTNLPCPPAADGRSQTRINGICIPNTGMSQCGGPNADDQFVCDAYKNGKKITTTVVQ